MDKNSFHESLDVMKRVAPTSQPVSTGSKINHLKTVYHAFGKLFMIYFHTERKKLHELHFLKLKNVLHVVASKVKNTI